MQISMQMRLAKLKHPDWHAGAVGKETAVPGRHAGLGLSLPSATCSGEGDAGYEVTAQVPQLRSLHSPGGHFPLGGERLVLVNTQQSIFVDCSFIS